MAEMTMVLEGFISQYLWRDDCSGRSIFVFKTKKDMSNLEQALRGSRISFFSKKEKIMNYIGIEETWYHITVDATVCPIPYYEAGAPLTLTGRFLDASTPNNAVFCFQLLSIKENSTDDTVNINYLMNMGVKAKDAQTIVDAAKEYVSGNRGLLEFCKQPYASKIISDATTLKNDEARELVKKVLKTNEERELFSWLGQMGVSYTECSKAVKKFGSNAEMMLKKDPYKNGKLLKMSFLECDRIAKSSGMIATHPTRMKAALDECMEKWTENGNIWASSAQLDTEYLLLMRQKAFTENVPFTAALPYMDDLAEHGWKNGKLIFYPERLMDAERSICENIQRLAQTKKRMPCDVYKLLAESEQENGIKYGKEQTEAFLDIVKYQGGVFILTGGPGTGKTNTCKGILQAYKKIFPNHTVKLSAPTGRASQRLSEATGLEATTVHRLLEYRPYGDSISCKNWKDPINADFILVDEASMLDSELASMLFSAIKTGTKLLLVGDENQLEAVGAGAVLRDLLKPNNVGINKHRLTEVFRQKGGSPIVENAIKIQKCETKLLECDDFQIIPSKSAEESLGIVKDLSVRLFDKNDPFSTQVLCPSRKGLSGIESINNELQKLLNPSTAYAIHYGEREFRIGDKIMMTRNNYEMDYYNGDIGTIVEFQKNGNTVVAIRDTELELPRDLLDDMQLSYGMTVHKSQGSEFANCIIVMPKEPANMLIKNLFYTAVTRAKKRVFIINENAAMEKAIMHNPAKTRQTFLGKLLADCS